MKTYWDLNEDQRAALSREELSHYLRIECMQAGVVEPKKPELQPVPDLPDVKCIRLFVPVVRDKYGSRVELGFGFLNRQDAEKFTNVEVMHLGYSSLPGGQSASGPENPVIMDKAYPLVSEEAQGEKLMKIINEIKQNNKKKLEDYRKQMDAVQDVCDSVLEDWESCKEQARNKEHVRELYQDYLETCEGNEKLAKKFLRKAISVYMIEKTFGSGWLDEAEEAVADEA